jgi:hypothetical protein
LRVTERKKIEGEGRQGEEWEDRGNRKEAVL